MEQNNRHRQPPASKGQEKKSGSFSDKEKECRLIRDLLFLICWYFWEWKEPGQR